MTSSPAAPDVDPPPLPTATVEPRPARSLAWVLPAITILAVALLAYDAWRAPGVDVRVRLAAGHGIAAGAPVRYLGVEVGRVREVGLGPELAGVELLVHLDGDAVPLAREGSRFWVERARIGSDGVSGLETLFAGPYLAAQPGAPGARALREFQGLDAPPLDAAGGAGLEVVAEAPRRGGVAAGALVSYRQIPVGRVLSVGLASDAGAVELRLWVEPEYAALVREGTRFWETSGLSLTAGLLDGLDVSFDSLESLLAGGVAFATPPDAGPAARTGQRFALNAAPEAHWLEWRPAVAVGQGELLPGGAPARPLRAALSFESGRLWSSRRGASGWVLPIDGRLLGPADLLLAPEGAREGSATVEVSGLALTVARASDDDRKGLVLVDASGIDAPGWPRERRRALGETEDVVVWADAAREPLAVAASRLRALTRDDGSVRAWSAGEGLALDGAEWHGALVLARSDGALLGLLLATDGALTVAPLPAELSTAR